MEKGIDLEAKFEMSPILQTSRRQKFPDVKVNLNGEFYGIFTINGELIEGNLSKTEVLWVAEAIERNSARLIELWEEA